MTRYDLAIIGSGPGGYVAALYASRRKLKVCVIEEGLVGGTCLNRGCIPTKSLIHAASISSSLKHAKAFGLETGSCRLDYSKAVSRKDEVVSRLRTGIETLFRANKIDLISSRGRLSSGSTIDLGPAGSISATNIMIATGSRASGLSGIKIDESSVLSSDGILNIRSVPGSIIIVGGGVVGCEFASLFNALGSKVTIVEAMETLLPGLSREISKKLETIFRKNGCDIYTSSKVESVISGDRVRATLAGGVSLEAEKMLVSAGRAANTEDLGIEAAGVSIASGRIRVDDRLRTDSPGIYAIGDCVSGPQLAHKASYDGILACDNILGADRRADYSVIPNCIWTEPEIATVGLSEDEAKSKDADAKSAKFPYMASGKAFLEGKTEGFIKIVGTPAGDILGVEIIGNSACELINEAALAKSMKINIKDWSRVVHAHPTLSEIIQEAAQVFCGTPLHSV
jgi:dihydrolipoamide dehydrogenase